MIEGCSIRLTGVCSTTDIVLIPFGKKRELSGQVKLSISPSTFVATLTNNHKLWTVKKRMRSRIKVV